METKKSLTKMYDNSAVDYMITKNKRWFGATPFEMVLVGIGIVVMTLLPFLTAAVPYGFDFSGNPFDKEIATRTAYGVWDIVITLAGVVTIAGASMLSARNRHSWWVITVEALLYGMHSFFALQSYALGSINMFIIPIIMIASHFFWKGHTDGGEIKTRKLNLQEGALVVTGVLALTAALGSMFIYGFGAGEPTSWISWVDALMGSIMAVGFIMSALRFRETWVVFVISNIVKIVAWTVAISLGSSGFESSLALAWILLFNAVFGLLVWRRSEKIKLIK